MKLERVVSIIVPCRNEAGHVEAFVASAFAQRLPELWSLDIVIADGDSDDGTREALARIALGEPRLRIVANPARIVSAGLNRALAEAKGEVVVRMDVHTTYASDYVAECLAALAASGADNVGGPWKAEAAAGGGPMQAAIAAAFQSRWVAGGALSRHLGYDGWVDTVYLGTWPRATFERFGGFDEALVRNQDDEHNLRIVRGGGRIWQSHRIRSAYRPRPRLGQVFRQYLQYGYWKPFVMKKHGQAAALRHLLPAALVLAVCAGSLLAGMTGWWWPLAALLATYAGAVFAMSAGVAASAPRAGVFGLLLRLPAVIVTYHLAYGLGSLAGWADVLRGRGGQARYANLTR